MKRFIRYIPAFIVGFLVSLVIFFIPLLHGSPFRSLQSFVYTALTNALPGVVTFGSYLYLICTPFLLLFLCVFWINGRIAKESNKVAYILISISAFYLGVTLSVILLGIMVATAINNMQIPG